MRNPPNPFLVLSLFFFFLSFPSVIRWIWWLSCRFEFVLIGLGPWSGSESESLLSSYIFFCLGDLIGYCESCFCCLGCCSVRFVDLCQKTRDEKEREVEKKVCFSSFLGVFKCGETPGRLRIPSTRSALSARMCPRLGSRSRWLLFLLRSKSDSTLKNCMAGLFLHWVAPRITSGEWGVKFHSLNKQYSLLTWTDRNHGSLGVWTGKEV